MPVMTLYLTEQMDKELISLKGKWDLKSKTDVVLRLINLGLKDTKRK